MNAQEAADNQYIATISYQPEEACRLRRHPAARAAVTRDV